MAEDKDKMATGAGRAAGGNQRGGANRAAGNAGMGLQFATVC
ncbi:MAG TPA: hypothetical protein VKG84_05075 [Candidatus Acidoferrales bacterium]|nr:hypothetical protein [Candidatus Acidoferrales bacterium]